MRKRFGYNRAGAIALTNVRIRILLAAAGLLGACVRYQSPVVSRDGFEPGERPVRLGAGRASATYIFGLGPIGDDSVGAAVARAVGKDGVTLANMQIDRRTVTIPGPFLPIVTRVETRVSGTVTAYAADTPEKAAPAAPAPTAAPEPAQTEADPFLNFFRGLRRGAAVELKLADGRTLKGNFGALKDGAIALGGGFLGSQTVALGDVIEIRSQTIRGEPVWMRRTPKP